MYYTCINTLFQYVYTCADSKFVQVWIPHKQVKHIIGIDAVLHELLL